MLPTRKTRRPHPQASTERRAFMDRLEARIYLAHLGHEVFLPDAASHGAKGLERVAETYTFANHRRGKLILPS